MFNSSRFYELAAEIRRTLRCKQETAEYLAALSQWIEEGIPSDAFVLQGEASVFDRLPEGVTEKAA
jgi:hypothetical protein